MGYWNIHISGHGIHDNGRADDADAIVREAVAKLKKHGHEVLAATFMVGSLPKDITDTDDEGSALENIDASVARSTREGVSA